MKDSRAVTEEEFEQIQRDVFNGLYNDWELNKILLTITIQRRVLRELFNLFHTEPLRRVSTTDPVPNSTLKYLKELVSMEDGR